MSNQTRVQSIKAAGPPGEAEYNAVYAAVTATERGRWFLAEFASRNREADTDLIMAAIARIEAAIRGGQVPQAATPCEPVAAAPTATAPTAAAPTAAAPTAAIPAAAAATIAPSRPTAGERDEDAADAEVANAEVANAEVANAEVADAEVANVLAPEPPPPDMHRRSDPAPDAQARKDKDYSDAVAAIAASLTTRLEESAKSLDSGLDLGSDLIKEASVREAAGAAEPPSVPADLVRPEAKPEAGAKPRMPQDNTPRWHIEGPDFVFGATAQDDRIISAEPPRETAQMQSQLLGAELMNAELTAEPGEALAAAGEGAPAIDTAADLAPAAHAGEAAAAATASAPILEIVPLPEISRPQLRVARETPVAQRPPRFGSLTVTDALSEDEVIALFG